MLFSSSDVHFLCHYVQGIKIVSNTVKNSLLENKFYKTLSTFYILTVVLKMLYVDMQCLLEDLFINAFILRTWPGWSLDSCAVSWTLTLRCLYIIPGECK